MRRTAVVLALFLVAGCGGNGSPTEATEQLTPMEAVRAAAAKPATSSRVEMTTTTDVNGQKTVITMTGISGGTPSSPLGEMTMRVGPQTIRQVIVGGVLYMQMPGEKLYHRLPLEELSGTPLAEGANPASGSELLKAMSGHVADLGTETIRGEKTTHYKGTISIAEAEKLSNEFTRTSVGRLAELGVTSIPTDVYLDDEGRIRRMVQNLTMNVQGQKATTVTQFDSFDFGVKVDVKAPPASQVKDGTELLNSLKQQYGG